MPPDEERPPSGTRRFITGSAATPECPMGDALARMVDPTVLVPVVLLVVAEFSTLARDLDLRAAVAEERPPLVVDFVIHGGLTYPRVLRREVAGILHPVLAVAAERTGRELDLPNRPAVPEDVRSVAEVARPVLLPNLGQFGVVHLTNSGLLIFAFATTAGSGTGLSYVQHLLGVVLAMLPLLEVGEYGEIQAALDRMHSFAFHLGVNVDVFIAFVRPPSFLEDGVTPVASPYVYLVWWFATGYLYLVVLAADIRRMGSQE